MGFVSVDTQRVLALLCVAPHCHTDMEEPPLDMEDRFLERAKYGGVRWGRQFCKAQTESVRLNRFMSNSE